MIKRMICTCLAAAAVIAAIPAYIVYAGTAVTNMENVSMNQHYQYQEISFNFDNAANPIPKKGKGPLYDDIYFDSEAVWSRKTDNGINFVTPGERDNAAFAFCIDLEKSKLLGAARKGDLAVSASATFRNYNGDGDTGKTFVIEYNGSGAYLREHNSAAYDNNGDWYGRGFTSDANIGRDAKYLLFGAYGKREGGIANKNLDFDVSSIYGKITDQTGPKVVAVSDTATVNGKQYIRQDINKNDPSIIITMDEDCVFSSDNYVMLETKNGSNSKVTNLIYVGESGRDSSTGRVDYKFRINMASDKVGWGHYTKVRLWYLTGIKDTMGNSIAQTQPQYQQITCDKLIDTQAPYVTYPVNNDPRTIKVEDEFGLSWVNRNMVYLKNSAFSVGGGSNIFEVGDLENQPFSTSTKSVSVDFGQLTYSKTGLYDMNVTSADLAKNANGTYVYKNIFIITDSDPLKLTLQKDNAKLNISAGDITAQATDALTTMTLAADTSVVPASRLSNAVIYYRWLETRNDSVISSFTSEKAKWKQVKFTSNSSVTEPLTIPVTYKTDGSLEYLEPKFTEGYLYVVPEIDDDISSAAVYRTGSMAAGGDQTDGKFKNILMSKTVKGSFVNRGCDECTGQTPTDDTAEAHYAAIRNHTGDIGFDIENNSDLSKIMWSISEEGIPNSVLDYGIIERTPTTNQYSIPISKITGKTGSYTVTAALYSVYGDVSVKKIYVNMESPVIGISAGSILYDQARKNLDFTLTYNKESLENLSDIIIQFGGRDDTSFAEAATGTSISTYAISEGGVIEKGSWNTEMGDKLFIRTSFSQDSKDSRLMTADFRASLSNMENAGDEFIKAAGEKRVHLKYITSNKVETINDNITIIKKSNLPPSVSLSFGEEGKYFTSAEYNSDAHKIKVTVEEPILTLDKVYYKWVDTANSTLLKTDGTVKEDAEEVVVSGKKIIISPEVAALTGEELYKPLFLLVYAKNEADKAIEKVFGPFYVLNDNVNDKRFIITLNDKALDGNSLLAAVDDRLHMIEGLTKADKLRATWINSADNSVKSIKEYSLSFVKGDGEAVKTTNVSIVNILYPALSDTNGAGGTYVLHKAEIYNSADESNIFKVEVPSGIQHTLPEYFVKIDAITDGVRVTSGTDEISYAWSENPYDVPSSWTAAGGAAAGINFLPVENSSLINKRAYLFIKSQDNIYRSDEIILSCPSTYSAISGTVNVELGESDSGYYGIETGKKDSTLIKLTVENSDSLKDMQKVEVYDMFGSNPSQPIDVERLFKISDKSAYGLVPGLVTSGGAIKCIVCVNDSNIGEFTVSRAGDMPPGAYLGFDRNNRTVILDNDTEYLKYTLYDVQGKTYAFDSEGKTEVFMEGSYLLVYRNDQGIFAKELEIADITYTSGDVHAELDPDRPDEGKTEESVTAVVTMPLGSVIRDKYGIIHSVQNTGNKTVASAVVTRSAIYGFDIKFADDSTLKNYTVNIDYISEHYVPKADTVTPAAISYNSMVMTKDDVTAALDSSLTALNNNNFGSYTFDRNGTYSFIIRDMDGTLKEHTAEVSWIDKKCPEPVIRKYVWIDTDNDGQLDAGEKGIEIPEGYTTRYNVVVEIIFPGDGNAARPVKLSGSDRFTPENADENGFAYKYVMAYKPAESEGSRPKLVQNLMFTDTLGNTAEYGLIIDEIDKADLLTALNYSTTSPTNRDVVVSMSSNKAIERFDLVEETDADGNVKVVEKRSSPTYVFRENGTKDFNYREINVTEPEKGMLRANVTWIDKNVPKVEVQHPEELTNQSVKIVFTVKNGNSLGAMLKYGVSEIMLTAYGDDLKGTFTANENGRYMFTVITKYGNVGTFIVPITNIDKEPPEISINGREEVYIKAGTGYYDQGATAYDKRDGNITSGISAKSNVNASVATGSDYYTVVYTISDMAGNTASRTRKVHVLDIDSAVAVIENNIIDLKSKNVHDVKLSDTGIVYIEFVGIDGSYMAKYQDGETNERGNEYDNAYFKHSGRYLSKVGTVTVNYGIYTFYVQDQERNTRMIKINFVK